MDQRILIDSRQISRFANTLMSFSLRTLNCTCRLGSLGMYVHHGADLRGYMHTYIPLYLAYISVFWKPTTLFLTHIITGSRTKC